MEPAESFPVEVTYNNELITATVTPLPPAEESTAADYEVNVLDQSFTIHQDVDEHGLPGWRLKTGVASADMVKCVGEGIEAYYL